MKTKLRPAALWIGIAVAAALFVGNYHIVYGSHTNLRIVKKISFSFNEVLVNMDELMATPPYLLPTRYPLYLQTPN